MCLILKPKLQETSRCPLRFMDGWLYRVNQHMTATQMTDLCATTQQTVASLGELWFWRHLILWEVPPVWLQLHSPCSQEDPGPRTVSWDGGMWLRQITHSLEINHVALRDELTLSKVKYLVYLSRLLYSTLMVSQSKFFSQMGAIY